MDIKRIVVGSLQENCYILEKNNKVLVIDPGDEGNRINKVIGSKDVVGILITHGHDDHIGALDDVLSKHKCQVYKYGDVELDKDIIIDDFKFKVLYTPGHRDDSVCYYFEDENCLFSGDFIFEGGIGRTDLEFGDANKMKESIRFILTYSNNFKIYPGHGTSTCLDDERDNLEYYLNVLR